jgi:hypothetical protein
VDITEWMAELEQDLLCHVEDELRSREMNAAVKQETKRVIYRCGRKGCGHTWAFDYMINRRPHGVDRLGYPKHIINLLRQVDGKVIDQSYGHDHVCPKCQGRNRTQTNEVNGTYSEHKCDSRCTSAKGADCECGCGGANHGSDWL